MKEVNIAGLCLCGCGQATQIATRTDSRKGWKKGFPQQFISWHHLYLKAEDKHPLWNGGRSACTGYIKIRIAKNIYKFEHRIIAERLVGHPLPPTVGIHHYNGRENNAQFVICQDNAYHKLLHLRTKALIACGHATWRRCQYCHTYDDPQNLIINGTAAHRQCRNSCRREFYARKGHGAEIARGGPA
jgi:hypothetical protein